MRLASVEIEGFKSFPKRTKLAFTPGITAVIGPNGSGKSNVTEAIRWVLGEQSVKQLRGKDSRDIIFHGTDKQPAARRARVTLTFANDSGRFPGGAAEVAISRSLTRDGESRYMVNGDDVRLLDLQRLLAEAGIGARTTAVISQGMVDRYLTATPAGRKELFDEATGVRSLQIQLQEAHRKLQKTQQHTAEIETIIRELGPRLTVLRRQVKRYEQRQELESIYKTQQQAWFCYAWHDTNNTIEAAQAHITELRGTIEASRKRRVELEHSLMQASRDPESHKVQTRLAQAKLEYAQQTGNFEQYERQRKFLTESLANIRTSKQSAEAELARARKTSMQYDWLAQANSLLERCAEYLNNIVHGKNPIDMSTLVQEITAYLKRAKTVSAAEGAQLMMKTIEKPLQEVARLTALEEERKQALDALQPVSKPTRDTIEHLEATLASTHQTSSKPQLSSLEAVRSQELEAERSLGAAQAALEQHGRDLTRLEEDLLRECGSKTLQSIQQSAPPKAADTPSETHLRTLAAKLAAIGEPDPLVQKEYSEAASRHDYLTKQLRDVQETATNIVDLMGTLHTQMQQQFAKQFAIIRKSFASIFLQLFGGGAADISQVEEGIEISVTPPGKRSRHVHLLSGGERALTSLALLMAILEAQNPPFLVLDEVDAALDEANSRRFAELLRGQCNHTQCIVVTHNREVMSVADVLYGVTMAKEGVSSVYSVHLSDIDAAATHNQPSEEMKEMQI